MAIDWAAMAREVNAYLDGLKVNDRPMDYSFWEDVFDLSWSVIGSHARRHPESEWGQAIARHKALKAAWRARVLRAAASKLGSPGHVAKVARKFGLTEKQVAGLIQHARKDGVLPRGKRTAKQARATRIDWGAIALEVHKYLDELEPNARPMPHTYWADVHGLNWNSMNRRAKEHPASEWALALARHKAVHATWLKKFIKEVERRRTPKGYVRELSRDFGITEREAESIIHRAILDGMLSKPDYQFGGIAERILSVAKVGMTRFELATAAGISYRAIENHLRRDATSTIAYELRRRLVWKPGNPLKINEIRRSS